MFSKRIGWQVIFENFLVRPTFFSSTKSIFRFLNYATERKEKKKAHGPSRRWSLVQFTAHYVP